MKTGYGRPSGILIGGSDGAGGTDMTGSGGGIRKSECLDARGLLCGRDEEKECLEDLGERSTTLTGMVERECDEAPGERFSVR